VATRQTGLTERENVLLTWKPGATDGTQVFDVLFGPSAGGPFTRVNPVPLLSAAYLHARPPGSGSYIIEARGLGGAASRSSPFTG
jgi:L-iduronidase